MGPHYSDIDVREGYCAPLTNDTKPLLIRRAISHWLAVSRWSLNYFASRFPAQRICLEKFDPMSEISYLEQTVRNEHKEVPFEYLRTELGLGRTCYAVRENSDIFRDIPSLLDDLDAFRPFSVDADSYKSLWIGPEGYVTGMHTDPGPTLVFQICGSKRVVLFAPSEAQRVYAVRRDGVRERFSNMSLRSSLGPTELHDLAERTGWADVQPFASDLSRYPLFADAEGLNCVLRAGETLYIPDGWWHAVKGLELAISVAAEPCIADSGRER
jgi:lysine-specific demethylase 8